ncbi:Endonuclease/Exonuclease/phosphatase family protein [Corynebacterium glaucum]|uniref:endonuclease/exonuclease/phosphatase family protein n=1 Tax=Corynebacterium glaucum TaxID=187491 RepID=UPI0025B54BF3|nr:endonuclease/exonuclease/phosphatase family protein [Corynebacterium glaucum]WJZ08247.1 Endonuclease/Exonuclease/phosphatase family protein [Corynebacterium glaucum]
MLTGTRIRIRTFATVVAAVLFAALLIFVPQSIAPSASADENSNSTTDTTTDIELNILSLNLWGGASFVPDGKGYADTAAIIEELGADIVFFQETGDAAEPIADELGFNAHVTGGSVSVISRYDFVETGVIKDHAGNPRWAKATVKVGDDVVTVYSGHLEYRAYANYWPRGYAGEALGDGWPDNYRTWDPLDAPVTDEATLKQINLESRRPDSARALIADADAEAAKGRFVIFGGDFNEASALDWTEETKDTFERNGVAREWETTQTLLDAGYVDSYRTIYPDPLTHPGITWPTKQGHKSAEEAAWAKGADERDRIDYIFFAPNERLALNQAAIVGPEESISKSKAVVDGTADTFIVPTSAPWISDHRGMMAKFTIKAPAQGSATETATETSSAQPSTSAEPSTSTEPTTKPSNPVIAVALNIIAGLINLIGNFFGSERLAKIADQVRSFQR